MKIKLTIWLLLVLVMVMILDSCNPDLTPPTIPIDEKKVLQGTKSLTSEADVLIEGVYRIKPGGDEFGPLAVIKKTGDQFSVFFGKSISYAILYAGEKKGTVYFEGYWRFAQNSNTGSMSLTIDPTAGASDVLSGKKPSVLILTGTYKLYGVDKKISLEYQRPIHIDTNYYIISHRGGGRNIDRLPASENSVEMIKYSERLGVNGIEIDVQLTKDSIPVIFHDEYMNKRLINEDYFIGKVSDYTYAQLRAFVTLKNGEKIPTLEEALKAAMDNNAIKLVWLDSKYPSVVRKIAPIQKKFLDQAKSKNRNIRVLIGIPDEDILNAYLKIDNHKNYPALCELDSSLFVKSTAEVWAPRWSLGLQPDMVKSVHDQSKQAFVWTLDVPDFIHTFIKDGKFDGILTNYPTQVAYEFYAKE